MDLVNLYLLLPIAAYAYIFHHSIPSLAEPVERKELLPVVFGTALVISAAAYILIGGTISAYLGPAIFPASNLNWEGYMGRQQDQRLSGDGLSAVPPIYAKLISFFVVIVPAIDVASAYP